MSGMRQRLDDLAGVAGGAFSVLAGLKNEAQALAKSQAEAFAQRMELVRRDEFEAALELARRAREATEMLEEELRELRLRVARLENPTPTILLAGQADSSTTV